MNLKFKLIFIGMISVSCQKPAKKKNDNQELISQEGFRNLNIYQAKLNGAYEVEDTQCQNENQIFAPEKLSVYNWNGSETTVEENQSSGFDFTHYFSSQSVKKVLYNLQVSQMCEYSDDSLKCDGKKQIIPNTTKVLKICKSSAPYKRDSIEGIAITGAFHLDQIWSFYHTLNASKDNFEKSLLIVAPQYNENFQMSSNGKENKFQQTKTDNLAFNFSFQDAEGYSNQPAFIIYPTSDQAYPKNKKSLHLWESKWALSHEFGHHILFHHSKIKELTQNSLYLQKTLLSGNHKHLTDFSSTIPHKKQNELLLTNSRSISFSDHWGLINEAYADLFAFYSNRKQPQTTNNIPCLEVNRDILINHFANGTKKILDKSVTQEFYSSTIKENSDCNTPNFQSIHSMGAIIAYSLNELFSTYSQDSKVNGELILQWANIIGKSIKENYSNGKGMITLTYEDFILQAVQLVKNKSPNQNLNQIQCQIIERNFPILATKWSKDQSTNCL